MDFFFKETTLTDGSKVHDIQLKANGHSMIDGKPVCIFSCTSERDAEKFLHELEKLVMAFTLETLEERVRITGGCPVFRL